MHDTLKGQGEYQMTQIVKRKIGMVEDDQLQCEVVKQYLKASELAESYSLFHFTDALNGLKSFFETEYDLLIVDINLPGIDGFSMGSIVQDLYSYNTPIIYISSDERNLAEFNNIQFSKSKFLTKPFTKKELIDTIRSLQ